MKTISYSRRCFTVHLKRGAIKRSLFGFGSRFVRLTVAALLEAETAPTARLDCLKAFLSIFT